MVGNEGSDAGGQDNDRVMMIDGGDEEERGRGSSSNGGGTGRGDYGGGCSGNPDVNGAAVDGVKGVDLEVHDDEDGWETVSDDDEDDGDFIPNDTGLAAKVSDELDSDWDDDSFGRVDEDEASHSADSANDESEFYQLCQDLKHNDPNTTAVLTAQMPVPKGYALPLGRALYFGDNQHVTHLELDPDRLLLNKHDDKALYPLMDYLWEASALQLLRIRGKAAYTDGDVFMLMIPVAENHRLEELELLTDMAYHVNALREVMEGTTSIRSLVICLDRFYEVNDVPDDAARAIAANRSLERLVVHLEGITSILDAVVRRMSSHARLRELRFVFNPQHFYMRHDGPRLCTLLQSPTTALRCLQLGGCTFTSSSMDSLVAGLKGSQTLHELELSHCHLNQRTQQKLLKFFQSFDHDCKVRVLKLACRSDLPAHYGTVCNGSVLGSLAAQLLFRPKRKLGKGSSGEDGASLGSLLQKLCLDLDSLKSFCTVYASNIFGIRLPHLQIGSVNAIDWTSLQQFLPQAMHMTDLTIRVFEQPVNGKALLRALRRNGSLHRVHLYDATKDAKLQLNDVETRLKDAYLERNRTVPKLMSNLRFKSVSNSNNASMTARIGNADSGDTDVHNKGMIPSCFPTVTQSVQPVEQMGHGRVLTGLLKFGYSLGHGKCTADATHLSGNKRARLDEEMDDVQTTTAGGSGRSSVRACNKTQDTAAASTVARL